MDVAVWAEIRRLHHIERLSRRAIARRLRCSRHTVDRALTLDHPQASIRPKRASLLEPYTARIAEIVAEHPDLSAVRIREEIAKHGYQGEVSLVRRYLHRMRPARGRVYQEAIWELGDAMQVDWGDCGSIHIGQTQRRVSVFVAVLCYSRMGVGIRGEARWSRNGLERGSEKTGAQAVDVNGGGRSSPGGPRSLAPTPRRVAPTGIECLD